MYFVVAWFLLALRQHTFFFSGSCSIAALIEKRHSVGVVKDPVLFIQSKVRTVEYTTKTASTTECDTGPAIDSEALMEEEAQPQTQMEAEDSPCQSDLVADEQSQAP